MRNDRSEQWLFKPFRTCFLIALLSLFFNNQKKDFLNKYRSRVERSYLLFFFVLQSKLLKSLTKKTDLIKKCLSKKIDLIFESAFFF